MTLESTAPATASVTKMTPEDAAYHRAMEALRSGDDEAIFLLKKWLADYPVSFRRQNVLAAIGDWYFARGNFAEAYGYYEMISPESPDEVTAEAVMARRAYCLLLLGERRQAAEAYSKLTSSKEWGNDARFYLAYISYLDKDYDAALRGFSAVDTSSEPGCGAPYYMAQIYFLKGEWNRSLNLAKQLIASGTVAEFLPECNRIAGESLYNLDRESEAIPYLWKYCAETTTPEPGAFYILGVSEYRAGHIDDAIKLLQRAIGTHSAMEQSAWLFLGQAYAARGDNSSALMAFENAYKTDYDPKVRETAFYNYAVARMEGGRVPFGNSVALLDDFLSQYPDSRYASDVQRYIINGYMTDNDYESAIAAIDRVKSPTPAILKARQRALFVLATREYSAGKTASALERLRQAAATPDGDKTIARQCQLWLGDCFYRQGSYDNAAAAYRRYLESTPATAAEAYNRRLATYDLGYALFAAENYPEALRQFEKVISSKGDIGNRTIADAHSRAADCHYYMMQLDKAQEGYAKSLEMNPEAGDYAMFQLAVMKGLTKDHKAKIDLLDRLPREYPSSGLLPAAMLEKAESQMALGRSADAIATYRALVDTYPLTSQGRNGYLQLAITYMNLGRRDDAIASYRKVISTYPSSEEARIASDDLKKIYAADGRLDEFAKFLKSVPDAPEFDASEIEQLTFAAAENDFIDKGLTAKLEKFVSDYPRSTRAAQATYYLAEASWNEGDADKALDYASRVVDNYPDSEPVEDAMLIMGNAQAALGKTEPALDTFTALEKKASGSNMIHEARMGIMNTASALGRHSTVVAAADKLLSSTAATSSSTAAIRFTRAYALNAMKRHDEAYSEWKALAADPADISGAKSAYYLGQSQLDRGRIDDALATADRLISSNTPHSYWLARGFILYSDVLRAKGDTFEADEYLKSLKANYPGSEADIFQMINNRLK